MTDKTYAEIVASCNRLADLFYAMQGYRSRPEFKFYEATHPQETLMWCLAVMAYDHIEGTDVEDALTCMQEGDI